MAKQVETEWIGCPKCGARAELEQNYLGGIGWHMTAWCTADHHHQVPVVRDALGFWTEAEYQPTGDGMTYKVISKAQAERERAAAECLTESDYLARMDGGEPWEYEPEMPPADPVFITEAESTAQERYWLDVGALLKMRNFVVELPDGPDRMAGVWCTMAVRSGQLPEPARRRELIRVAMAYGWKPDNIQMSREVL